MSEDYKGEFKDIAREYDISIKLVRMLDGDGELSGYLRYLDSMNEDDSRVTKAIRMGADFNKGGAVHIDYRKKGLFK
tara:strand:+ start:404 stop:634 length:231 start_codon:yes stop_codon:yes gene_type:complete